MSYKTYNKYKKSNIEWIGNIPTPWKIDKIKNMAYVKGRIGWHGLTSEEYADNGAYLVTGTDFVKGDIAWSNCNHISYDRYNQDPNIHLKTGDLLITKDGTIGKLALIKDIPDKATLNSGIFLVRPTTKHYINEYLYWVLFSDIFIRFFDYIKKGSTISHLYQETFEGFIFPYPNIKEQKQIANYLDKKTAKIDTIIAKNEELIQLLEEKRVALINQVVTKGLNPDVPMKDSGVEWIGKIPEHWNIMKLKHHGFVLGGYAFKSGDFTDSGVKVVKITNVQSLKFDWSECFYLPKSYLHEHSEFKINKGDIIFALTRPIISTGIKAAIFDENEPALANQRTGIFKKHSNDLISTFLYYVIYSDYFKEDFKSKITATNQPNISPLDIGEIKLIIPSVEEQKQIVSKLDEETKKISEVISKIKENINLLEEYKTSLIHHVVTGKIDVRGEEI